MTKIEAVTLEAAYLDAASTLKCSITELQIEVVQQPSSGFLGLFKKSAIIVVIKKEIEKVEPQAEPKVEVKTEVKKVVEKKKFESVKQTLRDSGVCNESS